MVESYGIATLKADKTHPAPEVDKLLELLGNKGGSIPFYAIFPAGNPNKPILLDGVFTSPKPIVDALKKAGPSKGVMQVADAVVPGKKFTQPDVRLEVRAEKGLLASQKELAHVTETAAKPTPAISPEEADVERNRTKYVPASFGEHVQISAHLNRDVLRAGDTFRLAVIFDIQEGWHTYGNPLGPGIGQKTVISASAAPESFQFDPPRYAAAEKKEQDFGEAGKSWVWEHTGKTIHYLSGNVAADVEPGQYEWTIEASAQVCDPTTCLPGKAILRFPVTVVSGDSPSKLINQGVFQQIAKAKYAPSDQTTQ